MLMVYTSYSCSSCKKAMKWLEEHGIMYTEYNFFSKELTKEEVFNMLKYSGHGFEDIISERSKIYGKYKDGLEEMTTYELIDFIIENPVILKRPLIVDSVTESIYIGYNVNEMEELI